MVLLTVMEYPEEIENDVEKMKEQGFSKAEIIDCMYDLKNALNDKINDLEGGW